MADRRRFLFGCAGALLCPASLGVVAEGPKKKHRPEDQVTYPPELPGGREFVKDRSEQFLVPSGPLQPGVTIARTPPTVEFMFYPGQTYAGNPWSNWGDSLAVGGNYYASIGDHHSLGDAAGVTHSGNALVYEYDPQARKLRQLVDVKKLLGLPEGHYTPGKIHGRIDQGDDGWLYFATYRGGHSTRAEYHYRGDWILRAHPATGRSEVVASGPVPHHGIQTSVLDPKRMIFYGGTRAGAVDPRGSNRGPDDERFFAYDLRARKLLYSGPKRSCWPWPLLARSTGRVYYVQGTGEERHLMRYDPGRGGPPVKIEGPAEFEGASTQETPQGYIYTATSDREAGKAAIWSFNTRTEEVLELGPPHIGSTPRVIASLDADPGGRYLYYTPGAHGGSEIDGTPIVQFDVRTRQRKVIAFLHPFYQERYGCTLRGKYSSAVDANGARLYVTWNVSRGSQVWDCCALTVIHIPASERE